MGSIYQAKSKTSGKCYVGQTQDTKTKDGKPYKYGIAGRWSDHVSSAFRGAKTPLAQAILEFGADDFELTCLEKGLTEERLDEREAHWIAHLESIVPNGYNVMRHARCKHRERTTLAEHYLPTTTKVRLTVVKAKGLPKLVYVYLDQGEKEAVRLVYGQSGKATFETAIEEAQEFAAIFAEKGIDVFEEEADDPLRKYSEKIEQLRDKTVERIRIAKFNHLVALHIKTSDGTQRMCFGGKTISPTDAYKIAINVKNKIMETHTNVLLEDDMSKSATGGCP
jgi:hypothetical protein